MRVLDMHELKLVSGGDLSCHKDDPAPDLRSTSEKIADYIKVWALFN